MVASGAPAFQTLFPARNGGHPADADGSVPLLEKGSTIRGLVHVFDGASTLNVPSLARMGLKWSSSPTPFSPQRSPPPQDFGERNTLTDPGATATVPGVASPVMMSVVPS